MIAFLECSLLKHVLSNLEMFFFLVGTLKCFGYWNLEVVIRVYLTIVEFCFVFLFCVEKFSGIFGL